jgi:hypothetical protein
VLDGIFNPKYEKRPTIHHDVYPLVDEFNVVKWGLWEKWNEGEYPNK